LRENNEEKVSFSLPTLFLELRVMGAFLVCSEEPRADLEGAVAGLAAAATTTGGGGVGITSAAATAAIEHTGQNQASDAQGDSDREGDGDVGRVQGSRRWGRRRW
jgi:hypothetical protein